MSAARCLVCGGTGANGQRDCAACGGDGGGTALPPASASCAHHDFIADVRVARLKDTGRFMAEITINCAQCHKPFQFLGLEPGLDLQGARVSIDGLEANIAICPKGERPNPLQRLAHNVRSFDG